MKHFIVSITVREAEIELTKFRTVFYGKVEMVGVFWFNRQDILKVVNNSPTLASLQNNLVMDSCVFR